MTQSETRICIVGAGSVNWTPTLLQDLALMPGLTGTVVLHDIAPEPLAVMERLARRIVALAGADIAIEATTDWDIALPGAQFVVVTISTGGLRAMQHDLEIPARYGVIQSVGDTVGPGGLARGLRNIPVMVALARAMETHCPDAWLLNLTNPMATTTRAIARETKIRVVGLCHETDNVRETLGRMFAVPDEALDFVVAGTNHLPWLLTLTIDGQDAFPLLREYVAAGRPIPRQATHVGVKESFQDNWQVKLTLFDLFGALPAAGDRHVAEFFPWFLTPETHAGADYGVLLTTIPQRVEIGRQTRAQVDAWLAGTRPFALTRSREPIADIIAAVSSGRTFRTVVNLPNQGQIANVPSGAVVETMGILGPTGAHPLSVGPLPPGILNTVHPHVINQELIVEAALSGDRSLALQALVNDPLIRDPRTAPQLLDDLLAATPAD
jgi:alpha-galactosidase/6-phospho-beta-glucosidase family protein